VLWEEDLEKFMEKHGSKWGRYLDVDGDGIAYRTIPGNLNTKSAYFARGTGHDEYAQYSEDAQEWEMGLNRIKRKLDNSRDTLPKPIIVPAGNTRIGIVASGSANPAVEEALDILGLKGTPVDYLRVRSIPFSSDVHNFLNNHDRIYVVEMNRDGQLHQLLSLEFPEQVEKLIKTAHSDGLPLTAKWITNAILSHEEIMK
jgi:2-oxoglutarate ferredoxin oxidoreductase subunit alpha